MARWWVMGLLVAVLVGTMPACQTTSAELDDGTVVEETRLDPEALAELHAIGIEIIDVVREIRAERAAREDVESERSHERLTDLLEQLAALREQQAALRAE